MRDFLIKRNCCYILQKIFKPLTYKANNMTYKIVTYFLLFICFNSTCFEISQELHEKFTEAVCEAKRLSQGKKVRCTTKISNCTLNFHHSKTGFNFQSQKVLKLEPTLLCKTHSAIALEWKTVEPLSFLLEIRSNNTPWTNPKTTTCFTWTINSLQPNTDYQMRLWGISTLHEIFGPYESTWITTTPVHYTPLPVSKLKIIETRLVEKQFVALLEWTPAEDRSCFYNLAWYGYDDTSIRSAQQREIREISPIHRYNVTNLELGTEYTIKINSISGNMQRESNATKITYHTPTCIEVFNNLDICVPPPPENLEVFDEPSSHGSDINQTYIVRVSWNKPSLIPDNYTVTIMPWNSSIPYDSIVVEGNETSAVFYDLQLDVIYFVRVRVFSKGGDNFADVTKQITKQLPNWFTSNQISIMIGSVFGAIIAIIVFLLLYRRYKIKKSKGMCKTPVPNCYGDNFKGKYLPEFKNSSTEYDIPEVINDKWQLKSNEIVVDVVLGEGAFGVVHKGYMKTSDGKNAEVAIKMLKGNPNMEEIKQFEHEIEIMKSVGSHPHLVSLVGCCSKVGYLGPFLVVEYCAKGSLLLYLRAVWEHLAGQPSTSRYINTPCLPEDSKIDNHFSNKVYILSDDILLEPQDLLSFARQITLGMEYLSSLRVVHRDLALRNVLICENKTVKVADFGLSRDVYQDNVYLKTGTGKLPIKWMALESLSHQQYTTQSDVWSFGVTLWEIVTLSGNPYATISPRDMLSVLKSGYRMECPKNCSQELYTIMRMCWKECAKERPTFYDLRIMLEKLLESENRYVSLDIQ